MKKILIILLIVLFPLITSMQISSQDDFQKDQTFLAKISGNFVDKITSENILFYKQHVRIPLEFEVTEIQGDYYVYAQLYGKEPDNYSIEVSDVRYYSGPEIIDESVKKDFAITSEQAEFSVSPRVVKTGADFEIELQNLKSSQIIVDINKKSSSDYFGLFNQDTSEKQVTLESGEKESLQFEANNSGFSYVNFSSENTSYSVPVYSIIEEENETEKTEGLIFQSSNININLSTDSETKRFLYIKNTGEKDLENISIVLSDSLKQDVNLSQDIIDIEYNKTKKISLNIASGSEQDVIQGNIKLKKDLYLYDTLDVYLSFVPGFIPSDNSKTDDENKTLPSSSKTCEELNGTICTENEKCSEQQIDYAKDGVCCPGTCQEKSSGNSGKVLGWIILIAIALFLVWFFLFKYRKTQSKVDLLKNVKKK